MNIWTSNNLLFLLSLNFYRIICEYSQWLVVYLLILLDVCWSMTSISSARRRWLFLNQIKKTIRMRHDNTHARRCRKNGEMKDVNASIINDWKTWRKKRCDNQNSMLLVQGILDGSPLNKMEYTPFPSNFHCSSVEPLEILPSHVQHCFVQMVHTTRIVHIYYPVSITEIPLEYHATTWYMLVFFD